MNCTKMVGVISIVSMMVITLALSFSPVADATGEYDQDLGQFYSYTVCFQFDGQEAESISWEFGDTTTSTEWNPVHTFPAKGTYYVKQTVTNPLGSSTATYKVEIMGFPVISFDSNGGSSVSEIQQSAYNIKATKPADPVREGSTFAGWYSDTGFSSPVDWNSKLTASHTYYAKWISGAACTVLFINGSDVNRVTIGAGETITEPAAPVKEGYVFGGWYSDEACYTVFDFDSPINGDISIYAKWTAAGNGNDDDDGDKTAEHIVQLILAIIAFLVIACGAYFGRFDIVIVGGIVIAFAVLTYTGVIGWPL